MDTKGILKKEPGEWLTIHEVATRWHCHVRTVKDRIIKKRTPGIEWFKTPWGKWMARRQSVELFEQKMIYRTEKMLNPIIPSGRR